MFWGVMAAAVATIASIAPATKVLVAHGRRFVITVQTRPATPTKYAVKFTPDAKMPTAGGVVAVDVS